MRHILLDKQNEKYVRSEGDILDNVDQKSSIFFKYCFVISYKNHIRYIEFYRRC